MPSQIGNFFIKTLVTSPFHGILGNSLSVITVTGCKSGRKISTPVNTILVDQVMLVISMRSRTWWRNLRGGRTALLSTGGKRLLVKGEILEEPGLVLPVLQKYFEQYPTHAKYFKLPCGPDGRPDPAGLARLADERVIVRLHPE